MSFSLKEITLGLDIRLKPEMENIQFNNISSIETAKAEDISFLISEEYEHFLYTTKAKIVVVAEDFEPQQELSSRLIRVPDPKKTLQELLTRVEQRRQDTREGVENPHFIGEGVNLGRAIYLGAFSYIDSGAIIGDRVQIYPHVYIGKNVVVGEGSIVRSGAKIHEDVQIGKNVEIDFLCTIGSKGFGYAKNTDGTYKSVSQIGSVHIGDNCYIGANTSIDRATMGQTIVEEGTKIDNLVQIGHNVTIGKNVIVCGQVGIAGSTKIGDRVILAGQVGIADHLSIAEGVTLTARTALDKKVTTPNAVISGSPGSPFREDKYRLALIRRLPEIMTRLEKLENQSPKPLKN